MTDRPVSLINPDVPIRNSSEDLFSFTPLATDVARYMLSYDLSDSLVIGVSGSWGSGKTSLLNLIDEAISDQCKHKTNKATPAIVRYSPWLISNRSTLLADFLLLLCTKLVTETSGKIFGLRYLIMLKRQFWDYRKFRKYALAVSNRERNFDLFAREAPKVRIPILSEAWEVLCKTIDALRLKPDAINFDDLRSTACEALQRHKKRIIVLLDDLDRLEPDEIMGLLRLVRSTAQLPHITYVLCFDQKQVSETIKTKQGTDDNSYTDKIAQLFIDVPRIRSSALSNLLKEKLTTFITDSNTGTPSDSLSADQFDIAMEIITRQSVLKTPRDVARVHNAFTLEISRNEGKEKDHSKILVTCILQVKFPATHECAQKYLVTKHDSSNSFKNKDLSDNFVSELKMACKCDNAIFREIQSIIEILVPEIEWSSI